MLSCSGRHILGCSNARGTNALAHAVAYYGFSDGHIACRRSPTAAEARDGLSHRYLATQDLRPHSVVTKLFANNISHSH